MPGRIDDLDFKRDITKKELLNVLKNEARSIHIQDIMKASHFLREDAKYMPKIERDDYIARFTKAFFSRIKDIKDDKEEYSGQVNPLKLKEFLKVLSDQAQLSKDEYEDCFHVIARIVATYTTFIRKESIHPVGTRFPGGYTLRMVDGVYYCPVKDKQKDTPSALCRFCVSVQDESV